MDALEKQDGESLDMVGENIEALKAIFPDVFTENGIDFDTLRHLLGDEVADGEEKYGLTWHGKKQARQIALTPSTGTLRPCPGESVDWDATQNLFIEGDNLEVLKALQKSYAGKVKMIYIDPPYNTGNEFIYPDRFQDNLDTYLRYTGQKADDGTKLKSSTDGSGRLHTNWLNMMYPRLKLAKNLLTKDGIICIHIDENEYANLYHLLCEIFGEENDLGAIVWDKRNPKGKVGGVAQQHEYIFVFCKDKDAFAEGDYFYRKKQNAEIMLKRAEAEIRKAGGVNDDSRKAYRKWANDAKNGLSGGESAYCHIDDDGNVYRPVSMAAPDKPETRSHRPLLHPKTKKPCPVPEKGWRFPDASMDKLLEGGEILFGVDETTQPQRKYLLADNLKEAVPSLLYFGGSDDALGLPFDNPKPVRIAATLIEATCAEGDVLLDFFAGSCTAAHACMQVGAQENRHIRFIMVQLPEKIEEKSAAHKAGYELISDIGKDRIRKAARLLKDDFPDFKGDLGFKVFKLDSSNIRAWNPDADDLEKSLLDHSEHLVEGRSEQDVLYELLLKRGVDLTVPIEEKEIGGKTVYSIGYGVLFACLDTEIDKDEIETLAQGIVAWHGELEPASDTQVVFRDSAFADDIAKTNMTAILEQNGIAHVRSL